ncbi:DUF3311 domain-containing protein [Marinococcus halophilus]|nr:DUF3311 domain-containing protein [Marinococcus halophilus]
MVNRKLYVFYITATFIVLFMLESPIILIANRVEPFLLGMPFLVFWVFFWWLLCTCLFFVAYKTNWGRHSNN